MYQLLQVFIDYSLEIVTVWRLKMTKWKGKFKELIWTVWFRLWKKRTIVKETTTLEAFGVVEVILILVIILGLVIIFKGEIENIINDAIDSIKGKAGKIV